MKPEPTLPDPDDDARWAAVRERDEGAREAFLYAVRTTGVYCRPGCTGRLPKRENVVFFSTGEAAEQAGYRPCKRCAPQEPPRAVREARVVERACRLLDAGDPGLTALAREVGMSPSHFHRLFVRLTGVTPKAYAKDRRVARVRESLARGGAVTEAIYEAGIPPAGVFMKRPRRHWG